MREVIQSIWQLQRGNNIEITHFVWDGPCLMFFHFSSSCQCCKDFRTTAGSPSMSLRSVQNQKEIIVHKIQKKMKHENDSEWNKNSLKRRVTVRTSRWFYIVEEGLIKVSTPLPPSQHLWCVLKSPETWNWILISGPLSDFGVMWSACLKHRMRLSILKVLSK